jgi:hypothetical protein
MGWMSLVIKWVKALTLALPIGSLQQQSEKFNNKIHNCKKQKNLWWH